MLGNEWATSEGECLWTDDGDDEEDEGDERSEERRLLLSERLCQSPVLMSFTYFLKFEYCFKR